MYEILHEKPPQEELNFYLSYAEPGMRILEPLCGSGRFLVPFLERGLSVWGFDQSEEMLEKLRRKAPHAAVVRADIATYRSDIPFDYIYIPSGSVSLFTDMGICRELLGNMRAMLKKGGKFVFAVDTVACRCPDTEEYVLSIAVKTEENHDLLLKTKNTYDGPSRTQFSPGIYELYDGNKLLAQEEMDFRTHLYEPGEMEHMLEQVGFTDIRVYATFDKQPVEACLSEMFLYECRA